jgi:hypothetical protein
MIGLKLVDSIAKIEKDIRTALVKDLNTFFNTKKDVVIKKLKQKCKEWILQQPEINSLLGSSTPYSLNSLFGLQTGSAQDLTYRIADVVANSIEVKFSKIDNNFKGGLTLYFQPSDLQNLLGLSEGHVITEKGVDLHWLNWLLTQGDSVVVAGYRYEPDPEGRSGVGKMELGGSFRVPPAYSGVASNNFVTRALENREKEITQIMSEVFK